MAMILVWYVELETTLLPTPNAHHLSHVYRKHRDTLSVPDEVGHSTSTSAQDACSSEPSADSIVLEQTQSIWNILSVKYW